MANKKPPNRWEHLGSRGNRSAHPPLLHSSLPRAMLADMANPVAKIASMPKPKLRWFQYRLRTLFVLTAVVSVPYGWPAFKIAQFQRELRTVIAINHFGGTVDSHFPPADARQWYIIRIHLAGTRLTDADLLRILDPADPHNKVNTLDLAGTTVTDVGLAHLKRFVTLRTLNLTATSVTDAGVDKLQNALPNCKIIR